MKRSHFFSNYAVILLAALLLAGCDGDTQSSKQLNTAPRIANENASGFATGVAPVSAMMLLDEYKKDPTAADSKYKGRTLLISGTVEATGKSKSGIPFVSFQRPSAQSPTSALVVCSLEPAQAPSAETLRQGQEVRLKGRVQGALTGNVLLEDCALQY